MRFDTTNKIPLKYAKKRGFRDRRGIRCKQNVGVEFKQKYEEEIGNFKILRKDLPNIFATINNGSSNPSISNAWSFSANISWNGWFMDDEKEWRIRARR